ncbi:MAG TPA: NHL repeat-containing protein [Gemmataceae bacterium]|nr:NHL repeat-containing protein [Gemmataceae bacterium]
MAIRTIVAALTLLVGSLALSPSAPRGEPAHPSKEKPAAGAPARPGRFVLAWGKKGDGPGEFNIPIGIALGPHGDLFVSDFYNARVQRFSTAGKLLSAFPVLPNPGGIAVDRDGSVYLTHFSAMRLKEEPKPSRVTVYGPDGKLLREWGKTGTGPGEFDYPGGIAVSPAGRVYVCDQTNRRVQVFDRQGKFLFKWGRYGTGPGEFGGNINPKSRVGGPQFVALDAAGHVFTTEGSVGRVQVFTADGKFLRAWGSNDDRPGAFGGSYRQIKGSLRGPVGICVDAGGRLWVSAVSGRVQQFTADGKYLRGVGQGQGSGPGQFVAPHGVVTDGHGNLYVVDGHNCRVQKFDVGP